MTEESNKRKRTEGPDESDEVSDRYKRELVERYVKAFPAEQLTNILIEIVAQVPDAFDMLETYASNEVSHRKIFLRGIGPDTKHDVIKDFFTQFGVIEKAEIVGDKITGKNKGFAFILFEEIASVNKALASQCYEIDSKNIFVNLAALGKQYIESKDSQSIDDVEKRKLFVRNLNPTTTVESLKSYFSMHGDIESCNVVMDKVTKKSKNYGFVIYKNSASTSRALKDKNPMIDGKPAVVVLAVEGATKAVDPYQQQMMMAGYAYPGQPMPQTMVPQMAASQGSYMMTPNGLMQMQQPTVAYGSAQHFAHQPHAAQIPPPPPHQQQQTQQQRGIYQALPSHMQQQKW